VCDDGGGRYDDRNGRLLEFAPTYSASIRCADKGTVSSSRTIMHGQLRCTARLSTPLQVGHRTGLTFEVRNVTKRSVAPRLNYRSLAFVLHAADGTSYDSRVPLEDASGPAPGPVHFPAGATRTFRPADVWIRWQGPLSITPLCDGAVLPTLHATVAASEPPPSTAQAIVDVVKAARHLFDRCRPSSSGTSVTGVIEPPSGGAPPMHARCSFDFQHVGGFWVADTVVLVPGDLQGVHVRQPYDQVMMPAARQTAEAIAWEFVVTSDGRCRSRPARWTPQSHRVLWRRTGIGQEVDGKALAGRVAVVISAPEEDLRTWQSSSSRSALRDGPRPAPRFRATPGPERELPFRRLSGYSACGLCSLPDRPSAPGGCFCAPAAGAPLPGVRNALPPDLGRTDRGPTCWRLTPTPGQPPQVMSRTRGSGRPVSAR
jgi:hypothetical protein